MKPANNEVVEEGKEDSQKTDDQQKGASGIPPSPQYPGMKIGSKYQPGDEAGRLLWVPTPWSAPGDIRPDGTKYYGQRQEGKANNYAVIADTVKDYPLAVSQCFDAVWRRCVSKWRRASRHQAVFHKSKARPGIARKTHVLGLRQANHCSWALC